MEDCLLNDYNGDVSDDEHDLECTDDATTKIPSSHASAVAPEKTGRPLPESSIPNVVIGPKSEPDGSSFTNRCSNQEQEQEQEQEQDCALVDYRAMVGYLLLNNDNEPSEQRPEAGDGVVLGPTDETLRNTSSLSALGLEPNLVCSKDVGTVEATCAARKRRLTNVYHGADDGLEKPRYDDRVAKLARIEVSCD
jgi:hypothetical protein